MRKNSSKISSKVFNRTLVAATIVCIGWQPANAGLLGMPLHLRAAIEAVNPGAESVGRALFFPRHTDDFLTGPIVLTEC